MSASQRKKKWSFRSFSLRMLLLLTTLFCIGLGVWRVVIRPYQLQEQAAARIEELGGSVHLVPGDSTWLAKLMGKERFNEVVKVNLERHDDGAEYADQLALLPRLESLHVGCNFGDAEMAKLANCTNLKHLHFQDTQITDVGLRVCEGLPQLRLLLLGRNISDDGLTVLRDAQHLAYLDLSNTQVTDRGLESLRKLPSLHKLFLTDRPITDAGLEAIMTLPKLDELYLAGCREITDDGLLSLASKKQLKQLNVRRTKIKPETIKTLERELPTCRILQDDRFYY